MAKQTFSVGQVLTAAQMTSLQQTAMLGGAASAKTASYTLVAADAGTAISMSSTSATTITVNTGLFAAGDTVQITNLNTGVCTITAGTATVNTSASLALAQYESGTLDFTSASAAIFIKGGSAAGAYTSLASGSLSGSSLDLSSISSGYINLVLIFRDFYPNTDDYLRIALNNTANVYGQTGPGGADSSLTNAFITPFSTTAIDNVDSFNYMQFQINDYSNTTTGKSSQNIGAIRNTTGTTFRLQSMDAFSNITSAIDRITISFNGGATFSGGTYQLYGVK